jgi:foldase protein PrsA
MIISATDSISAAPSAQEATEEPIPATEELITPTLTLPIPILVVGDYVITDDQFSRQALLERGLLIYQLKNALRLFAAMGYAPDQLEEVVTEQEPYASWYNQLLHTEDLGISVLNKMIEHLVLQQSAFHLGIRVSDEALTDNINRAFGYDSAEPNSAAEAAKAKEIFFAEVQASTGLPEHIIRDYFYMAALQDIMRDTLFAVLPRTTIFADVRHILLNDEVTANDVLQKLEEGEDFASLAQTYSLDTGSGANGGELGVTDVHNFVDEFADAVLSAEIGAIVGPVKTPFGWHILQVKARGERALSDNEYTAERDREFRKYLDDLRADPQAYIRTFDNWLEYVPTEPAFSLDAELE